MTISRRSLMQHTIGAGGLIMLNGFSTQKSRKLIINIFGTATLDVEQQGWEHLQAELSERGFAIEINFQDNGNDVGPVINAMMRGSALEDYQLGGLQGGAERELAEDGLIVPWDLSLIPNWSSVWPQAK